MKLNLTTILAAASFGLLLASHGGVIAPSSWKQSNAFNTNRVAANLSNAAGMDATERFLYNQNTTISAPGETAGVDGKSWATSAKVTAPATLATEMTAGKVWIVADLGSAQTINNIRLWNFQWQNGASNLANRGVNQFDILVRNTAEDTDDGTAGGTAINLTSVSDLGGAISNSAVFNLGTSNPWTIALENQTLAQAPNNDAYSGQGYNLPPGTTARFIAIRVDSFYGGSGIGLGKVRFFSSDEIPPLISTTNPADNALSVPGNSNLVATFDEPIQAGTGFITIKRTSDNSEVEAFDVESSDRLTFTPGSSQVTIDPTVNLVGGTEYYVQIAPTAIKDAANNAFAGIVDPDTTRWSFTADNTRPLLTGTVPLDNANDVAATTNLVATFDEAIQAGTGFITIKRTSNNSEVESFNVAISTQLTFSGAQVTIDPTVNLLVGVEYYVQIDDGAITDLSGNAYLGIVDPDTTTWSFTIDNTAPVLSVVSPATPTLALPGTRLLAQFNEPVQAGTGTVKIFKASDASEVESIDVTTPGAAANNGGVVAIVRSVVLDPNTTYYVNATAGAFQDISGNPAAAITGTSAWTFTTSSAVPVVVENFNGSSAPLAGTAADTFAVAITSAGGSATWAAAIGFLENGALTGGNTSAYLNLGSYIDSTKGTSAGKFELTMTIAETRGGSWFSLGFATTNTPATTQNFTANSGIATIIYRGQDQSPAGELDMFGGPGNGNSVDGPDGNTGFRTLTATLDLTPAGGYNGTDNFGTVFWSDSILGAIGSYIYTADPSFGSILISKTANTTGTINALALYQTGTPSNTFASWIGSFAFTGFVNPDLTPTGDPDNDGLENAVENLFGTSPEVFSPGLTTVSASGGNLVFRHTLSATPASDLTGAYEWSVDLVNWNADEASAGGTTVTFGNPVIIIPGTPDLVEITATVTGTPASKVFARYKATQN